MTLPDRHLWGAGAAACAVCCAPPVLALVGMAGTGLAVTVATVAFAGLVFGLVVGAAAITSVFIRRRRDAAPASQSACEPPASSPVEVSLTSRPIEAS